jgi:hypothetical protein
MISLSASSKYGFTGQYIARITGRNSKYTFEREFIGRKSGKRHDISTADVDDPGLYECCDFDKYGKHSNFNLILEVDGSLGEFGCQKEDAMEIAKALDSRRSFSSIVSICNPDSDAVEILSEWQILDGVLRDCRVTDSIIILPVRIDQYEIGMTVKGSDLSPVLVAKLDSLNKKLEELKSQRKFAYRTYEILSEKKAEKHQSAKTIEAAIESCWDILHELPVAIKEKIS